MRPGAENQNALSAVYLPFEQWSPWMRCNLAASPRAAARVRESVRSFILSEMATASKAVLSAEALSDFPPGAVVQLRDDLEAIGYSDVHVVLYIRDPAAYYLSVIQENLKQPIDPPLVPDPLSFRYRFREIADTWAQVFPGRLLVRKFTTDPHHNVIDDFNAVLRQCLDVSLPRVDVRMNTSLSAEGMQILQDYRETFRADTVLLTPDVRQLTGFLSQSIHEVPQTRPVLKTAVAEAIRANYRADAEAVRSRYGVDLGLDGHRSAVAASTRQSYRVEDIVASVDSQIVHQLLLRLAHTELGRSPDPASLPRRIAVRSLPRRTAAWVYWRMPPSLRPTSAAARLHGTGRRPGGRGTRC